MVNLSISPKISIIMSTYNRAAYIVATIDSIRSQTYPNWELIIIDDGSDDNTEEIIRQINDDRIQFYKAGRIGIGGKVKNIGLEKACGELIAFIDSDDLWAATKLEKQVEVLQQYPDAGFSITSGYNFKKPEEPLEYFYKQKEGARHDHLFNSCFTSDVAMFTQALMLRKECIGAAGTFREAKSFSDIDFIINLAYHFKGVILYEPLVFRRLHTENYIHANWEKSYYEGIEIIEIYKEKLPAKIVRSALFRLYIDFGEVYMRKRKKKKAISIFREAWKNKPLSIIPLKKMAKAILYFSKK
jgi:glycosyltransferase involved in cell wall biosynthesis